MICESQDKNSPILNGTSQSQVSTWSQNNLRENNMATPSTIGDFAIAEPFKNCANYLYMTRTWFLLTLFPKTRMHPSRMHTAYFSGRLYQRGVCLWVQGGVSLWVQGAVYYPLSPQPLSPHPFTPFHPFHYTPCEQNDWQTGVEKLPCPKLRLRAVLIDWLRYL